MNDKEFWRRLDTLREAAETGAKQVGRAAAAAAETVRENFNVSITKDGVYEDCCVSAEFLREEIGDFQPEVLMILGSGLGFLGDLVEDPVWVDYEDIPYFQHSTAPGHRGRLVFGVLRGKNVAIMQGRMHTYEGYTMREVAYAVRVVRLLGADKMIVTNAAGAVCKEFSPGDIMLITDHIKLTGGSPLTGPNVPEFGVRFPDMTHAYDGAFQEIAWDAARELDIPLREGVYMFFPGPQFETPAEVRAARVLGADAVGMSTVPEVIAANHCGMKVLGFSLCANMAAGILDWPLDEQEVLEAAEKARDRFSALVCGCLEKM